MNPVWNDSMPTTDSKPTIFPNLRDLQTIGLPVHMVYEKLAFGSQWKKKENAQKNPYTYHNKHNFA